MHGGIRSKVEGTGPQGTKVSGKSGGLFKRIRMNRNVQMEPAAAGPSEAIRD